MPFDELVRVVAMVSIVFAAAWGGTALMRRRSAASRHAVWSAAVVVALVLPVGALLGPSWELRLPAPSAGEAGAGSPEESAETGLPAAMRLPAEPVEAAAVDGAGVEAADVPVSAVLTAGMAEPVESGTPFLALSQTVALVAIWAVGFAVCIARLLAGLCWTWWTARRARHVTQPDWVTDLAAASASLGLRAPVTMLTSTHAAMPAVHGLWRARLLLPAQAQAWTAERRRVVLLHELAHVLRRDVAVQILARLAAAVHWFNPLAHMAVRQLRIEQERACDDVVLACGPSGTEYADHLVEIAQGGRASLAGADGWVTVGMARPTQLETRLHAILDPGADRRALSLRSRALLAASVMAVALPLASLRVTAAAAAPGQSPGTVEGTVEPVPTTPEPVPTTPEPAPTTREPASRTPEPARVVAVAPGSVTSGARVSAVAAPAVVAAAPGGGRQVAAVQSVPATAAPTALVSAVQAAAQAEQSQDTRRRAVEALTIAVGDDNENVRLQAVRALAGLGGSVAVDALTRALKDESPRIRAEAAQALGAVAHGAAGAQQREQAAVRELRAREMEMAFTAQRRQFDTELAELQRQLQRTQEGGASLENLRRELEVSATQRRDLEARLREMERALAEARRELEQARQR